MLGDKISMLLYNLDIIIHIQDGIHTIVRYIESLHFCDVV